MDTGGDHEDTYDVVHIIHTKRVEWVSIFRGGWEVVYRCCFALLEELIPGSQDARCTFVQVSKDIKLAGFEAVITLVLDSVKENNW